MKFITFLLQIKRKLGSTKAKEDSFRKIGREQFKKLLERGLSVPVALL